MKAIGFDLGDTLLCYEGVPLSWTEHYKPAFKYAIENLEIEPNENTLNIASEVFRKYNTRIYPREKEFSSEVIFREIFKALHIDSQNIKEAEVKFFEYFQRKCIAYNESKTTLQSLKASGIKVGVLTDVPYGMSRELVIKDLKQAGLYSMIDVLITSVEAGFRKPHLHGYKKLSNSLGVNITDLIYVGNEEKDIRGCNNAGGVSVLINRTNKILNYGQYRTINLLSDLTL